MKNYVILPIILAVALSVVHCSEKKVAEDSEASTVHGQSGQHNQSAQGDDNQQSHATATLADSGRTNRIAVSKGSLKNASVVVPPGALAVDTSVTAKQGKQPKEFKVKKSKKASAPMVIEAKRGDVEKTVSGSPMKIAIPIKKSGFSLFASQAKHPNLAALHIDGQGHLTIWRRHKLAVVNNVAIFKSKKFGTYQLVFLGSGGAEDFTETEEDPPEEKDNEDKEDRNNGSNDDNDDKDDGDD